MDQITITTDLRERLLTNIRAFRKLDDDTAILTEEEYDTAVRALDDLMDDLAELEVALS